MALPVIPEKLYSVDDLWELSHRPENAEKRLQLIEGELSEMAPAGGEHGGIALELGALIRNFVKDRDLGYRTAAETGYVLYRSPNGKDTVLAPDVGFVLKERLPQGLPSRYVPLAPDLAVEVVSPTDSADEVDQKVTLYLRYGTRLVWVIYPKTQTVVAHRPDGIMRFGIDDTVSGEDVLPGFQFTVSELFQI